MSEQTPLNPEITASSKGQVDYVPHFNLADTENIPPEALKHLEALQEGAQTDRETYTEAIGIYAAHPEAAVAVLALAREPKGLVALGVIADVFQSGDDLTVGFDEKTEAALDNDPMLQRYRKLMRDKRGEEALDAKQRMRLYRVRAAFGLLPSASPDTDPENASAA